MDQIEKPLLAIEFVPWNICVLPLFHAIFNSVWLRGKEF